jgi:hypothetical protein
MMTPWLPPDYDEYPSIRIDKTPSLQVEFLKTDNHLFEEGDCKIYGSNATLIAAKFCLSETDSGSLHAGKFQASIHGVSPGTHVNGLTSALANDR